MAVGIALAGGPVGEWTTVYLIERSLSLDNVFLFSLLLAYFLVPSELRGRVILIGIAGALLLVAVIAADIAFAVDSIPAAFAVTRDPLVIWTANAFALLGLGSLLALVEILVRRFRYVDETIALVLAFVGIKILAADVVQISDLASLAVVAALLAAGIVASLVADRLAPPRATDEATRRPPRCPRELSPPAPSVRRSISNKAAPRTKT